MWVIVQLEMTVSRKAVGGAILGSLVHATALLKKATIRSHSAALIDTT